MVRSTIRTVVAATLACMASGSYAGEQMAKISDLQIRASDGLIAVTLEGSHTGKPACATQNYWLIKSETSLTGKQQYAALLGAKLAGRTVRLLGSNTCVRWADGEDIDSLQVLD